MPIIARIGEWRSGVSNGQKIETWVKYFAHLTHSFAEEIRFDHIRSSSSVNQREGPLEWHPVLCCTRSNLVKFFFFMWKHKSCKIWYKEVFTKQDWLRWLTDQLLGVKAKQQRWKKGRNCPTLWQACSNKNYSGCDLCRNNSKLCWKLRA